MDWNILEILTHIHDLRHLTTPIFRVKILDTDNYLPIELVGSGFFVGDRPTLITCKHTFDRYPLNDNECYGYFLHGPDIQSGSKSNVFYWRKVTDYHLSDKYDIASLKVDIPNSVETKITPLPFLKPPITQTDFVVCYEYSDVLREKCFEHGQSMHFNPRCHIGNIMQIHDIEYITSFPALQGASGAPLIEKDSFGLVGMMVGSHDQEPIPAQIIKIIHDDNESDETKYYLPNGVALKSEFIIEYLNEIGENIHSINYGESILKDWN